MRSRWAGWALLACLVLALILVPFLLGEQPTIADISLSGYVFFPVEESGIDIAAAHPHLGAWIARLRQLPGWGDPYDVMPGERIAPKWA